MDEWLAAVRVPEMRAGAAKGEAEDDGTDRAGGRVRELEGDIVDGAGVDRYGVDGCRRRTPQELARKCVAPRIGSASTSRGAS